MPKCKNTTKFIPAAFAWSLLLSCTALFYYYPCFHWYWRELSLWVIPLYQGILAVFVIMNFSLATFMDPGVIPRASAEEDREDDFRAPLYRNVEINGITVRMKWCVTCQFYRPPRCSHCSVCNNCIEIFDHHCPWVNNCIGRRNYRYFFMFLISLSVHMTSIFVLCLIHVLHKKDNLNEAPVLVSIILLAIISLLFIPIFGLTGFHLVLVSRGRTTNEQVTGKFRGGYNPFSQNCLFNCCNTLCGPQYPSLKHPGKYIGKKPRKYTIPAKPLAPGGQSSSQQHIPADQVRIYSSSSGVGVSMSGGQNAHYSRMNAVGGRDIDEDLDDPMTSQSRDVIETSMTHNSSKNNFYISPDEPPQAVLGNPARGSFKNAVKYNPQYGTGSPHSNQRLSSQPPDQTSAAAMHSPNVQKISRMGVPTPFAGVTSVPSPLRYSQPTVTSGARPEYIPLQQQQQHEVGPGYVQAQATSPGRRYLSDGELLDSSAGQPPPGTSSPPQKSYYIWKEPPPQQAGSYASQVNYYLQQSQQQQQEQTTLQSGAPRTTPSGYPGGPVVPSGSTTVTSHTSSSPIGVGYTTTGRPSVHQQQPMSFTRALEMTENIEEPGQVGYRPPQDQKQEQLHRDGKPGDGDKRESVYDMNSYEISV